jgi:hypothetical protein
VVIVLGQGRAGDGQRGRGERQSEKFLHWGFPLIEPSLTMSTSAARRVEPDQASGCAFLRGGERSLRQPRGQREAGPPTGKVEGPA